MNAMDFLPKLERWDNRIYKIIKLETSGKNVSLTFRSRESPIVSYYLQFPKVANFEYSLFGGVGDSDQLPQGLIGLEYWHADEDNDGVFHWELNGDQCTWNFRAALPQVSRVINYGAS